MLPGPINRPSWVLPEPEMVNELLRRIHVLAVVLCTERVPLVELFSQIWFVPMITAEVPVVEPADVLLTKTFPEFAVRTIPVPEFSVI